MICNPVEHYIATPEGDICWFEWGQRSDAAPSVLLLHATGFHARVWDKVVAHLPPGTHVIAPDHRGHGRSYRPATLLDWTATADALLPLVDSFAGTPLLGCGHSMGGYALSRLAALRPEAFCHMMLIDATIISPEHYQNPEAGSIDPADHPVSRRRNQWAGPDAMIAHFSDRLPYSAWDTDVLADYCRYGLRPDPAGDGWELACPPALESSNYQGAFRHNPYSWLNRFAAPATVIRARIGERAGPSDFSSSPTWPELGAQLGAVVDEQWNDHSHFIPMEAPARIATLIARQLSSPDQG